MRFQAEGEEERRQRVALVDSTCGRESVAMASGIPEEVLGCPAREHVCTGDELRRVAFQFAEALISVRRAKRVLGVQGEKHQVCICLRERPRGVGQAFGAGWHADRELVATQSSCHLFFPCPAESAPCEAAQQARGGDGTHTAARLVKSRELGNGENLRSAFWHVPGSHTASNLVERIKCSR